MEREIADEQDPRAEPVFGWREIQIAHHRERRERDVHPIEIVDEIQREHQRNEPPRAFREDAFVAHLISSGGTHCSTGSCVQEFLHGIFTQSFEQSLMQGRPRADHALLHRTRLIVAQRFTRLRRDAAARLAHDEVARREVPVGFVGERDHRVEIALRHQPHAIGDGGARFHVSGGHGVGHCGSSMKSRPVSGRLCRKSAFALALRAAPFMCAPCPIAAANISSVIGIEDCRGNRPAPVHHSGDNGEMRATPQETVRAVDRIDHEDART